METEHYVLTANSHDGLPCMLLLSLGLHLLPGELAFNHTSRLDNHKQSATPLDLWSSYFALSDNFWRGNTLKKKSLEHSDVLCRTSY